MQPLTGAAEYAWGARAGLEGGAGRRASSRLRDHYLESVDTLGLYFNRAHSTQYDAGTHYYHSPPASRSNRSRRAILATNHGSSTFQRTWHAWLSKVSNHTFTRLEASRAVRPARSVAGSVSPNTVRTQRRRAESQSQSQCVHAGNQLLFRRSPPRPRPPGEHEAHSILSSTRARRPHTKRGAVPLAHSSSTDCTT